MYGGSSERPSHNAPDSEWLEFLRQKYDERKFALPHKANEGKESKNDTSTARYVPTVTLIDLDTQVATTKSQPSDFFQSLDYKILIMSISVSSTTSHRRYIASDLVAS
jgi:hypothetical protein